MNTNTHSVRQRIAAAAVAAIVLPVFAACGADIDPPTQTINRGNTDKTTTTVPEHKSGNRLDFGDEYGKREAKKNTGAPASERSLNRLNFRDNGL